MVYLQEKAGDIPSCLKSFFLNENPQLQAKSFEWIEETFEKIAQRSIRTLVSDFKQYVSVYLSTLAELDSERTVKLVRQQFDNDQAFVVSGLSLSPEAQLQYLESWSESSTSLENTLPKDMLQLYLRLLCAYKPSDMLQALKKIDDIPYDLCLPLCKERHLTDAIAYLYETQGDHKGALDTYVQVTSTQIIDDKRIRLQQRMADGQVLSKFETCEVREIIAKSMLLCERSKGEADYWFALMDKIFDSFKTFMPHFGDYPKIEEIMSEAISEILGKIVAHVDLDEVVTRLVDHFKGIPFKVYKQELISILKSYSFQKQLLRTAQGTFGLHMKDLAHAGLMQRKLGLTSKSLVCVVCQKPLSGTVTMFICGHGKHRDCSSEPVCDLCQVQESRQSKMRRLLSPKA